MGKGHLQNGLYSFHVVCTSSPRAIADTWIFVAIHHLKSNIHRSCSNQSFNYAISPFDALGQGKSHLREDRTCLQIPSKLQPRSSPTNSKLPRISIHQLPTSSLLGTPLEENPVNIQSLVFPPLNQPILHSPLPKNVLFLHSEPPNNKTAPPRNIHNRVLPPLMPPILGPRIRITDPTLGSHHERRAWHRLRRQAPPPLHTERNRKRQERKNNQKRKQHASLRH